MHRTTCCLTKRRARCTPTICQLRALWSHQLIKPICTFVTFVKDDWHNLTTLILIQAFFYLTYSRNPAVAFRAHHPSTSTKLQICRRANCCSSLSYVRHLFGIKHAVHQHARWPTTLLIGMQKSLVRSAHPSATGK